MSIAARIRPGGDDDHCLERGEPPDRACPMAPPPPLATREAAPKTGARRSYVLRLYCTIRPMAAILGRWSPSSWRSPTSSSTWEPKTHGGTASVMASASLAMRLPPSYAFGPVHDLAKDRSWAKFFKYSAILASWDLRGPRQRQGRRPTELKRQGTRTARIALPRGRRHARTVTV